MPAGTPSSASDLLPVNTSPAACAPPPAPLQPLAPEERAAAERQRAAADRAARLSAVEQLLWGSASAAGAGSARSRWDPAAGGMLGRLQARALQRLLAVAVQYVRLEVTDVELKYVQVRAGGAPGAKSRSAPGGLPPAAGCDWRPCARAGT